MNALKLFVVLLAAGLVGSIVYIFYLQAGPFQEISEQNRKLKAEVERLQITLNETKDELSSKIRLTEAFQTEKAELENALASLKKEKTATSEDLRGKIQSLEQQNETIKTLRSKTDNLRQSLADLKSSGAELSRKADNLNRQLTNSRQQLKTVNEALESKDKKLAQMAESRQELEKSIKDLRAEKDTINDQLQSIRQAMVEKEKRFANLKETHGNLVAQLNKQIQQKELRISELKDRLKIQLLNKILFSPGNAVITSGGRKVLQEVADELKQIKDVQISVEGHTDNLPLSRESREVYHDNLGLSTARAEAVARMLRTMGVDAERLLASGYAMYRPIASNETPEGRQRNRRVEIVLTPRHDAE
jgi:chemotaxis protein MotB